MIVTRKIEVLDPQLANKIAAGEVVERPASVVKELVENSLDAGATAVTVEIKEGGVEYVRVTDNGCGIPEAEVKTAFLRHATSKLKSAEGLDSIETLGFRGEALASIAAVSRVTMRTRTKDEDCGTLIRIDGGNVTECLPCGCPTGTNIEMRELFYNVPARLKFLKAPRTEAGAVGDYMLRLILSSTAVSFKFINNDKPVYHSAGDGSLENALLCVYGSDILEHIKKVSYDDGYIMIDGVCGDDYLSKSSRVHQSIFVNGRYVRSQQLSFAAQRAYSTRLMVGKFPFLVLNIRISPREVDVNVHPNKLTVRFRDEERVASAVMLAVRDALDGNTLLPDADEKELDEAHKKPELTEIFKVDRSRPEETPDITIPKAETPREGIKSEAPAQKPAERIRETDKPEKVMVRDSGSAAPAPADYEVGAVRYSFLQDKELPEKAEVIEFDLNPYTVVGTAFDTYIIVEQGDAIFFIDQHAAHERILYERLIKNELRFDSQLLITAKVITLSPTDHALLLENIERFSELGFEIEEFGSTSISVHAVPNGVRMESVEKLVSEMLTIIRNNGGVTELDVVRASLIQSSCKHAIKAGRILDKRGIDEILSHFRDGSTPLTCPHGRPVMLRISKREFEKMFKRIQ